MNLYETVFIARQDIAPSQVDGLTQTFAEIIKTQGGDVVKTEYCGLKTMAYKIKKNRKGHYVQMNITASGDAVLEMERNMRINEDVLRYLTIRVEEHETNPSTLSQSRYQRDYTRGGQNDSSDESSESTVETQDEAFA